MSSTPQDANAFHAGKSPNGQQRTDATGVSPQLTVCQSRPHCLRRFYHARTMTGREYHYSLCGLLRNRELPDILSRHFSLSAFRQVVAYRCTRLCSSQSQRGNIWRMNIRLSRITPLIIEIPDRHGTGRKPDFITSYVNEAIGLKL